MVTTDNTRPSARFGALALGATALGALLAGCASTEVLTSTAPAATYQSNHPITLAEVPVNLDILIGTGARGLGAEDEARVMAFAAEAAREATSALVIIVPADSANASAASYAASEAVSLAQAAGVPAGSIQMARYQTGNPRLAAPMRLTYAHVGAVVGPCGLWTEPINRPLGNNAIDREFGCSTQANLAAMVANPADLVAPRAPTAIPADRRAGIIQRWTIGGSEALSTQGASQNPTSVGGTNG